VVNTGNENVRNLQHALRNAMTGHAGAVRDEAGLKQGLGELTAIRDAATRIGVHPDIAVITTWPTPSSSGRACWPPTPLLNAKDTWMPHRSEYPTSIRCKSTSSDPGTATSSANRSRRGRRADGAVSEDGTPVE
jgi:hypothetical protein